MEQTRGSNVKILYVHFFIRSETEAFVREILIHLHYNVDFDCNKIMYHDWTLPQDNGF